jgi:drug/metabolite transporter (DMT)-like permease
MRNDESHLPLIVFVGSIAVFLALDATMKGLLQTVPLTQGVFMRYVCGTLFCAVAFAARPARIKRSSLIANGMRGGLVAFVAMSFFFAVNRLPLANVIAIQFLSPFFLGLFGWMLLGERVPPRVIVGLVVGLGGVGIILGGQIGEGGGPEATAGFVAALLGAMSYGLSNVLVRRQSRHDPVTVMVLLQSAFAALFLAPFVVSDWQDLTLVQWAMFLFCGFLGTAGQLGAAWALSRARAARLAVLEYTAFLWATFYGFVGFGEVPTWATLAGAAVIVAACIVALRVPKKSPV